MIDMENDLFLWFLCGCYLLGGISIGYYFKAWRDRKGKRTGTADGIGPPEKTMATSLVRFIYLYR